MAKDQDVNSTNLRQTPVKTHRPYILPRACHILWNTIPELNVNHINIRTPPSLMAISPIPNDVSGI